MAWQGKELVDVLLVKFLIEKKILCRNAKKENKNKSLKKKNTLGIHANSYDKFQLWSLELVQAPNFCQGLGPGSGRGAGSALRFRSPRNGQKHSERRSAAAPRSNDNSAER